jgi:hypothetical protein
VDPTGRATGQSLRHIAESGALETVGVSVGTVPGESAVLLTRWAVAMPNPRRRWNFRGIIDCFVTRQNFRSVCWNRRAEDAIVLARRVAEVLGGGGIRFGVEPCDTRLGWGDAMRPFGEVVEKLRRDGLGTAGACRHTIADPTMWQE